MGSGAQGASAWVPQRWVPPSAPTYAIYSCVVVRGAARRLLRWTPLWGCPCTWMRARARHLGTPPFEIARPEKGPVVEICGSENERASHYGCGQAPASDRSVPTFCAVWVFAATDRRGLFEGFHPQLSRREYDNIIRLRAPFLIVYASIQTARPRINALFQSRTEIVPFSQ